MNDNVTLGALQVQPDCRRARQRQDHAGPPERVFVVCEKCTARLRNASLAKMVQSCNVAIVESRSLGLAADELRLAKRISVVKIRGSAHSTDLRRCRISGHRIAIGGKPLQFDGLRSGHPLARAPAQ